MDQDATKSLALRLGQALGARELPEGGFAERSGGPFDPVATALAVVAMEASGAGEELLAPPRYRLIQAMEPDGRLPISPRHLKAYWPTPLGLLALSGSVDFQAEQSRMAGFLLSMTGKHWAKDQGAASGHDPSIKGWPWILDTHSWVEPTAHVILALRATGHEDHERVREAVAMLLDRRIPDGGWNYGSKAVFGTDLLPVPESTGLALAALAGLCGREDVDAAIGYAKAELAHVRTPLALSWLLLGLSAWGERPGEAVALIQASLELEHRVGPFDTSLLAMLLMALNSGQGLLASLATRLDTAARWPEGGDHAE